MSNRLYIDDMAENQGVVFYMAVERGLDLISFAYAFMRSKARDFMDKELAYYCTLIPDMLLDQINVSSVKKAEGYQDGVEAQWIGEFYAWYQDTTGLSSSSIVERITPEFLDRHYGVLHDLDMSVAVGKLADRSVCK